jgi:tetrahydromethanopterin S-methyltransferase subunit C
MSQPAAPRDKLGVVSLILGLVGLVTSWVLIGVFFGIGAVVTGALGRARTKREAASSGVATAGLVLGVVSIVLGIAAAVGYYWLDAHQVEHYHECFLNGSWIHC